MTGALKSCFVNDLMILLHYSQLNALLLCCLLLRTDTERGDTAPGESDLAGQYWRHFLTEPLFFFKKVAKFVSMYLLWGKSHQKGLKVDNIVQKLRSCV